MTIHSFFNFIFHEMHDRGAEDFESQINPDVDLRAATSSHLVLNGIYALQGHYSEWEQSESFVELIQTIAFPIFGGLAALVLTNKVIGRSIMNNILDLALHATFFTINRIFFYSRGFGARTEWLDRITMDDGIVSQMIRISEICARFALQYFRDSKFPYHHYCFNVIAMMTTEYALVQLANKHDFCSDKWLMRNLVIKAHVTVVVAFLNESLGIKTKLESPFDLIKIYALAAIVFKFIPFERVFFLERWLQRLQ